MNLTSNMFDFRSSKWPSCAATDATTSGVACRAPSRAAPQQRSALQAPSQQLASKSPTLQHCAKVTSGPKQCAGSKSTGPKTPTVEGAWRGAWKEQGPFVFYLCVFFLAEWELC